MNEYPEIIITTIGPGGNRTQNSYNIIPEKVPFTAGGMEVINNMWRANIENGVVLVLVQQNGITVQPEDVQIFHDVLNENSHLHQNARQIADLINGFWDR